MQDDKPSGSAYGESSYQPPAILPTVQTTPEIAPPTPSKRPRRRKIIIIAILIITVILTSLGAARNAANRAAIEQQDQTPASEKLLPESSGPTETTFTEDPDGITKRATAQGQPVTSTPPASAVSGSAVVAGRLGIPASTTVLALPGMDFRLSNKMHLQLGGVFSKAPYKFQLVDYPRSSSPTSIAKGIANLDAALKATKGPKIVLGYSQGAQVASGWMRAHANDKSAPSAKDLTFILTGNPLRSTGGYGIGQPTWDGTKGIATPTNTPWRIIDIARRYDGWADWVADTKNTWAVTNANSGKFTIHGQYDQVDINNPTNTVWTYGNTTYVLTQEGLPMWRDKTDIPGSVVSAMKAHIESAYRRPSNDPKTVVTQTTNWYWNLMMQAWGIAGK